MARLGYTKPIVPVSSRARVDFDGLELDKSFVERSKESLDPVVPL